MKKFQNGFTVVEVLLLLVIVGLLSGVGLYVYNARNESSKDNSISQTVDTKKSSTTVDTKDSIKEYKNTEFSFSFKYPDDWKVVEEFSDSGRGREGSVDLTSPTGLTVSLSPNFGGRGGNCTPEPNDKPHQPGNNCPTREVLALEKITTMTADNKPFKDAPNLDIFFVRYRFSDIDGSTMYKMGLETGIYNYGDPSTKVELPLLNDPAMGLFLWFTSFNYSKGNMDVRLDGIDFSKKEVLQGSDMKQAESILKSFRLL